MRQKKNYGAIDNFRFLAALLIVAIHTSPLASFSGTADFLVTYCFGRIAVPFFFMVTGFFVLAPYQKAAARSQAGAGAPSHRRLGHSPVWKGSSSGKVWKFLRKTAVLYAAATALYFPIRIYSKQLEGKGIGDWLKDIFFDGTFYHLWYLPAVLMGCLLLMGLMKTCSPLMLSIASFALYLVGLLGDSYYGLVSQGKFLKPVYEGIFSISAFTRNGIFFAPVFLWMGVVIANGKIRLPRSQALTGFLVSLAGMLGEGLFTYQMGWQKHNSMYLFLLPAMFFLFLWLLSLEGEPFALVRDCSMCIYIIHPLCIILVRGVAGAINMTKLFVEQSFVHYLSVCAASVALSLLAAYGMQYIKEKRAFF